MTSDIPRECKIVWGVFTASQVALAVAGFVRGSQPMMVLGLLGTLLGVAVFILAALLTAKS